MNQPQPNLFHLATSELCQDAFIAYLLSWADPSLSGKDEDAHAASIALLRALFAKSKSPVTNLNIKSVRAGRQWEHIDVWCIVNDDTLLIIEDKTGSAEHGEQIASYIQKAGKFLVHGKPLREIHAVYMKTGNETAKSLIKANCGVFLRHDLLDVLAPFSNSSNTILRDFVQYLLTVEATSAAYKTTVPESWSWPMIQGFYSELELRMALELGITDAKWNQVNSVGGAFLALHWSRIPFPSRGYGLYLQIHDGKKLVLRLEDWDNGISTDQMRSLLPVALSLATSDSRFINLQIAKAGRFGGGSTAALVSFYSDSPTGVSSVSADGTLDLENTMQRIRVATEFAKALSVL